MADKKNYNFLWQPGKHYNFLWPSANFLPYDRQDRWTPGATTDSPSEDRKKTVQVGAN
jgi:hypothetical protein